MLAAFWAVVLTSGGALVTGLAWLGPPRHDQAAGRAPSPRAIAARLGGLTIVHPGPVRPALLTPAPDFPGAFLPRIARSGLTPRVAYAAAPVPATAPRLGLVVAGIGLATAPSEAAITALPAAVDLAVSAYARDPGAVMRAARDHGHEVLQSLPMEPRTYPTDSEGAAALLTGASLEDNQRNLEWVLSRGQGYAGVTGASDGQVGAGFAASPWLMSMVRREVAARGLFYLDPRPGTVAAGRAGERAADIVIDPTSENEATMAADLGRLRELALREGSAIGIVLRPDPVALAATTRFLAVSAGSGLVLAPVSALVTTNPPEAATP